MCFVSEGCMKVSAINNNVYVKKNNFYSSNKKVDNSQQNLTTFTEGNKKKSPWAIVLAILALIGSTSL